MPSQADATPASAPAGTIAGRGRLAARRARHRRSAAVHAENGPGDRCGDMAMTGHSHRSGKITATTYLPCPLAYPRGSFLPRRASRPRQPPTLPQQGTELATMRIPGKARAWQSYRPYSAISSISMATGLDLGSGAP